MEEIICDKKGRKNNGIASSFRLIIEWEQQKKQVKKADTKSGDWMWK